MRMARAGMWQPSRTPSEWPLYIMMYVELCFPNSQSLWCTSFHADTSEPMVKHDIQAPCIILPSRVCSSCFVSALPARNTQYNSIPLWVLKLKHRRSTSELKGMAPKLTLDHAITGCAVRVGGG
jgi:hypothetical protein